VSGSTAPESCVSGLRSTGGPKERTIDQVCQAAAAKARDAPGVVVVGVGDDFRHELVPFEGRYDRQDADG
jgi:hypothetical protein